MNPQECFHNFFRGIKEFFDFKKSDFNHELKYHFSLSEGNNNLENAQMNNTGVLSEFRSGA